MQRSRPPGNPRDEPKTVDRNSGLWGLRQRTRRHLGSDLKDSARTSRVACRRCKGVGWEAHCRSHGQLRATWRDTVNLVGELAAIIRPALSYLQTKVSRGQSQNSGGLAPSGPLAPLFLAAFPYNNPTNENLGPGRRRGRLRAPHESRGLRLGAGRVPRLEVGPEPFFLEGSPTSS